MAKRDYVESSGNVFADLGFADAEDRLAKAELAIKIAEILRRRKLTQTQAAAVLGVDQPKVSALIRGRLSGFSIERLLRFLLRLGTDVSITIKPHSAATKTARTDGKTRRKISGRGSSDCRRICSGQSLKSRRKQQPSRGHKAFNQKQLETPNFNRFQ